MIAPNIVTNRLIEVKTLRRMWVVILLRKITPCAVLNQSYFERTLHVVGYSGRFPKIFIYPITYRTINGALCKFTLN